jgi:pimeloyl-ACP methyl ester carboxylesterase
MASNQSDLQFKQLHYVQLPNGETYAYRKIGQSDRVLICLHANFSSGVYYSLFAPFLSKYFTVIAPNFRGFAHSTHNKPVQSHEDLAEDLKLFIDALKIPKCSLLAIGTAGGPAFFFGLKYPEKTDRVILYNSIGPKGFHFEDLTDTPHSKQELMKNSPIYAKFLQCIEKNDTQTVRDMITGIAGKIDEELLNTMAQEVVMQKNLADIAWINMNFNVSNEKNCIEVPGTNLVAKFKAKAVVLVGENDKVVEPEIQKEWKKLLGDNATLKILPGYSHAPGVDQAQEAANIIKEYLID